MYVYMFIFATINHPENVSICMYVCNRKYFVFLLSVATEQIDSVEQANHLPTQPLIDLLLNTPTTPIQTVEKLSFSQLRDILLDAAPLDVDHIRRVNAAEAAFWARSRGVRVADSTEILGFDCGGVRTSDSNYLMRIHTLMKSVCIYGYELYVHFFYNSIEATEYFLRVSH